MAEPSSVVTYTTSPPMAGLLRVNVTSASVVLALPSVTDTSATRDGGQVDGAAGRGGQHDEARSGGRRGSGPRERRA